MLFAAFHGPFKLLHMLGSGQQLEFDRGPSRAHRQTVEAQCLRTWYPDHPTPPQVDDFLTRHAAAGIVNQRHGHHTGMPSADQFGRTSR